MNFGTEIMHLMEGIDCSPTVKSATIAYLVDHGLRVRLGGAGAGSRSSAAGKGFAVRF